VNSALHFVDSVGHRGKSLLIPR